MGSVLLRREIPSFFSTSIWKDLDEVWTWETRNLGQVHHIYQHFYFERRPTKVERIARYKDVQFTQMTTSRRVWWHSDKISPGLENRRIWVAEVRVGGHSKWCLVHCRVCNECGGGHLKVWSLITLTLGAPLKKRGNCLAFFISVWSHSTDIW